MDQIIRMYGDEGAIWLAAAEDDSRPKLTYVRFEPWLNARGKHKRAFAVATDGFRIALTTFEVVADTAFEVCEIPAEFLAAAARARSRRGRSWPGYPAFDIHVKDGHASFEDRRGWKFTSPIQPTADGIFSGTYTDWRVLFESFKPVAAGEGLTHFAVDPTLLQMCVDACGFTAAKMTFAGVSQAVLLSETIDEDRPKAALLMPMFVQPDGVKTHARLLDEIGSSVKIVAKPPEAPEAQEALKTGDEKHVKED